MTSHTEPPSERNLGDRCGERMPHLLYVAWGFPPCRSGGVYRALATVNRFAARGWRVTVVSADRETFIRYTGTDTSLEHQVDPRVTVVRLPFVWPLREPDLRRWSRLRMERPRAWAKLRIYLDQVVFPEVGYGPWRRPLEAAAERIHRADPVDLVMSTANPHVAFTAGYRLWRRHGVPYVMDYRDAWLLDVFSGKCLHADNSRAGRWERRLVAGACEVWFVNDAIREWHARLYPAHAPKMHTVSNGFDRELSRGFRQHEAEPDSPLSFGYVGTVSSKVPLAQFVEGWRRARECSTDLASARAAIHGYLGFYATPQPDLLNLFESAADARISYEGPVSKGDIGRVYGTFDALLLLLGAGRYVTSGKVFEYAATGLPIVSVHDPDNATSDVLRDYPLWFPASSLEPEAIAQALVRAAGAARTAESRLRTRARSFGQRFSRDRQLDPRIEALAHKVKQPLEIA
jgi:glycosyltransferase involved in cell wall biosynthesis